MSPLRIEVSGIGKITIFADEKLLPGGVVVRARDDRNEVYMPHIIDINFTSDSRIKVRPFDETSSQLLLEKGEMEWEDKDGRKVRVQAVDILGNRK